MFVKRPAGDGRLAGAPAAICYRTPRESRKRRRRRAPGGAGVGKRKREDARAGRKRAPQGSAPLDGAGKSPAPSPAALPANRLGPPPLPTWVYAGPMLFFLAAVVFGFLEVHSSTDTWIGLAAGRQIMAQTDFLKLRETFPIHDTFSFTFHGTKWFNQNWLSHVYLWLLYDHFGPSAVIYGTWAACAATFLMVLLATRIRCGSWLAAIIAAGTVAAATRDWVSARPATIQFLFLATFWVCLSALLDQGRASRLWRSRRDAPAGPEAPPRRRIWPIVILLPLLLAWGCAHGSFALGYALTGLLLATWAGCRLLGWLRGRHDLTAISTAQAAALAAVTAAAAIITIQYGPYGVENFTHQQKIAGSEIFRGVSEWVTPFREARFPPVTRFWIAFGFAVASVIAALLLRRLARGEPGSAPLPGRLRYPLQVIFMDVIVTALSLYSGRSTGVLEARRFAPIFYILATPTLVFWIFLIARPVAEHVRHWVRQVMVLGSWGAALGVAGFGGVLAYRELVLPFANRPQYNLLERVTCYPQASPETVAFLRDTGVHANVWTDWTQAGVLMFHAPNCRVFMDGRAQQVYDERHYVLNQSISDPRYAAEALSLLHRFGTDTLLLRRTSDALAIYPIVARSREWVRVWESGDGAIFMALGSNALAELGRLERSGTISWPATAAALACRARILRYTDPMDAERSAQWWMASINADASQGLEGYSEVANALILLQRPADAITYLRGQGQRLDDPQLPVDANLRRALADEVRRCLRALEATSPGR
jgi:hypothetical protein